MAALDGAHGVGCPRDRRLGYVRGMRIAYRFVFDGAQAEALGGVVGRLFQPAIVEHQHFGLPVFQEQLAVVGALEPARDDFGKLRTVQTGAVDQRNWGRGHAVLRLFSISRLCLEALLGVSPYAPARRRSEALHISHLCALCMGGGYAVARSWPSSFSSPSIPPGRRAWSRPLHAGRAGGRPPGSRHCEER